MLRRGLAPQGKFARCAALALCAAGGPLVAHALDHPKRLVLRIDNQRAQVEIDYQIAAGPPAQELRAAFDRDRDGTLDPGEQAKLLAHHGAQAALWTSLTVDGAPLRLARAGEARGENLDLPVSSTALLAVRMTLGAALPPGGGDWRGRRAMVLTDGAPDRTGHVPVQVVCAGCEIADASSGVFAHDPKGDQVLGAETSMAQPLVLKVRLP